MCYHLTHCFIGKSHFLSLSHKIHKEHHHATLNGTHNYCIEEFFLHFFSNKKILYKRGSSLVCYLRKLVWFRKYLQLIINLNTSINYTHTCCSQTSCTIMKISFHLFIDTYTHISKKLSCILCSIHTIIYIFQASF